MTVGDDVRSQRLRLMVSVVCGLLLIAGFVLVEAWMRRDLADVGARQANRTCDGAKRPDVVALELAGTEARVRTLWENPALDLECTGPMAREEVRRDSLVIVAYVTTLVFWCAWGARNFRSRKMRTTGVVSAVFAGAAALLDLVENAGLQQIFERRYSAARWTAAASLTKWALLVVVIGYGCAALVVAVARLVVLLRGKVLPPDPQPVPDEAAWCATAFAADRLREVNDLAASTAMRHRWWWHGRPPTPTAWTSQQLRAEPLVGIALSGGGIRSACFNLGTVQASLATPFPGDASGRPVLERAGYLASVSGGGYLAGGRQIALHNGSPADAYCPRSPEERMLLANREFMWDTWCERLRGVGSLLRGIVINITVLTVLVFVLARPLGWAVGDRLLNDAAKAYSPGLLWVVAGGLAVIASVAWLLRNLGSVVGETARAVTTVTGLASAIVLTAAMVDARGSPWVLGSLAVIVAVGVLSIRLRPERDPERPEASTIDSTTPLPLWRRMLSAAAGMLIVLVAWTNATRWLEGGARHGISGSADAGWVLWAIAFVVALFLVAVFAIWLLLEPDAPRGLARAAIGITVGLPAVAVLAPIIIHVGLPGVDVLDAPDWQIHEFFLWGLLAFLMAVVLAFMDQRKWSPHVFYKRRLTTAFAPRRSDEDDRADPVPFSEPTPLSAWAAPKHDPELLVCAAVHLPGTTFGRRPAGSFTFTHELMGGPDVGWVRTAEVEHLVAHTSFANDLTLQAAIAVSGGALASAMGYFRLGAVNAWLALLNARLGVWLPNPTYVHELYGRRLAPEGGSGLLVTFRRIGYLLKEVLGIYDPLDRFVYVSDGGHHDNLGLIELLRRRCDIILSFDASNDKPIAPVKTFDDVRQRAFDELGVKFEPVDESEHEALQAGQGAVAAYRIRYPDLPAPPGTPDPGLPEGLGVLVFGKCTVAGRTLHWEGERPKRFPRDGTMNLWYSKRRLREYQALGQAVANQAISRLATVTAVPGAPDA